MCKHEKPYKKNYNLKKISCRTTNYQLTTTNQISNFALFSHTPPENSPSFNKHNFLMNKLFLLVFILLTFAGGAIAQETAAADTTIYLVADNPPRFPGCEQLDTTEVVIRDCAQRSLLSFIYGNVRYPYEAREQNLEGTVVVSFVVEKDGTISAPEIVKDLGGGTGDEVMRVITAMNGAFIRWKPGENAGVPVRTRFNLPVKFRLEEAPEYVMVGRDSVYTVLDSQAVFTAGAEGLTALIEANMQTPPAFRDSCFIGYADVSLLVNPDGSVKVMNVNDYNNLGTDFTFEAIRLGNLMTGKWTPAERNGRKVSTMTDFRLFFENENAQCASVRTDFERAQTLADEGEELYNNGETEAGLQKIDEALTLFPDNTNFLYLRGQIYMTEKNFEEACEDFTKVRNTLTNSPVEDFYRLICL